jgi:hypothetical protein
MILHSKQSWLTGSKRGSRTMDDFLQILCPYCLFL